MNSLKLLDKRLLTKLSDRSAQIERQRLAHNFHEGSERVQRMVNVLQPGTYLRPHRHVDRRSARGFEFLVMLEGELGVLLFLLRPSRWKNIR